VVAYERWSPYKSYKVFESFKNSISMKDKVVYIEIEKVTLTWIKIFLMLMYKVSLQKMKTIHVRIHSPVSYYNFFPYLLVSIRSFRPAGEAAVCTYFILSRISGKIRGITG
jgi:hypothetical protein